MGAAGGRPPRAPVPSHFLPTDVSAVPVVVDVLRGASVALLNHGAYSKVGGPTECICLRAGWGGGAWAGGDTQSGCVQQHLHAMLVEVVCCCGLRPACCVVPCTQLGLSSK